MLLSPQRDDPQRIVVLNPKGGCGKTTIATNLASYFAGRGPMPVLLDGDPQGASTCWLEKRSSRRPPIHGIAGFRNAINVTRTWQRRIPAESRQVIVDTPAGLDNPQIHDLIYDAHAVLIPVMPSAIDVRYAALLLEELSQFGGGSVAVVREDVDDQRYLPGRKTLVDQLDVVFALEFTTPVWTALLAFVQARISSCASLGTASRTSAARLISESRSTSSAMTRPVSSAMQSFPVCLAAVEALEAALPMKVDAFWAASGISSTNSASQPTSSSKMANSSRFPGFLVAATIRTSMVRGFWAPSR